MSWMKWLSIGFATVIAAALAYVSFPSPWHHVSCAGLLVMGICFAARSGGESRRIVVRLCGLSWTREAFCCGWLITGGVGTGKTRSGINQLLFQVFQNEPTWGGLVIDDKGLYWETLVGMARHFGPENDLILLQMERALDIPTHRYNLCSDRTIPFQTYGRMVVDTAVALGQNRDQSFFRTQGQTHISRALAALHELKYDVTLENAHNLLLSSDDLREAVRDLQAIGSENASALAAHFVEQYLDQPAEQQGGVRGTIFNYLNYFTTPAVAELFCRDSTFEMQDMDRGKIICLAMPQKYATERRYVSTFLKQLFYLHALRRFDRPEASRRRDNLLVLWADEAQHFVTAGEEGLTDYNAVDRIREANATVVMATQSSQSFVPALGRDKAKVLTLNLRNRMIFRAADEEDALASAEFLGQRKRMKVTRTTGKGGCSKSVTEEEVFRFKPHEIRQLRKHRCILVHSEKGFRRVLLPPIDSDGRVSHWFSRWSLG